MTDVQPTLLLSRSDVAELLPMSACIESIEKVFAAHANGATLSPGVLGTHAANSGGFHVKTAGFSEARAYYAAKVNSNFPDNSHAFGLPTIQGGLLLFDASNGSLLAIMDSAEITKIRTAAATAVAAKRLARRDSTIATIVGCGVQGTAHVDALTTVLPIRTIYAFDPLAGAAERFASDVSKPGRIDVQAIQTLREGTMKSDVIVTCTTSRAPFLARADLPEGVFVAAVGADSESKSEVQPEVFATSTVVVDIMEQCALIGDLHHALDAKAVTRDMVQGELAALIAGRIPGRTSPTETIIFDSTGTALEDVAAAAVVFERAVSTGRGLSVRLAS